MFEVVSQFWPSFSLSWEELCIFSQLYMDKDMLGFTNWLQQNLQAFNFSYPLVKTHFDDSTSGKKD